MVDGGLGAHLSVGDRGLEKVKLSILKFTKFTI